MAKGGTREVSEKEAFEALQKRQMAYLAFCFEAEGRRQAL